MKTAVKNIARNSLALLAVAAATLSSSSALAHHAFAAEFDAAKPIEVKGTLTKAKWTNPHSWIYLDVKGADGTVTNYGFEFGAPSALQGKGLTKSSLKPGDEISIKGFAAKNGGPFGYSVYLTLADGTRYQTGGAQDAPATP
jgi:hypothetical protein